MSLHNTDNSFSPVMTKKKTVNYLKWHEKIIKKKMTIIGKHGPKNIKNTHMQTHILL